MITLKIKSQKYNCGYKENTEIGEEEISYSDYKDLEQYATLLRMADFGVKDIYDYFVEGEDDEEIADIKEEIKSIKEEIEKYKSFWISDGLYSSESPEPYDGYTSTATEIRFEIVDKAKAKEEKLEQLTYRKEELLSELDSINEEINKIKE